MIPTLLLALRRWWPFLVVALLVTALVGSWVHWLHGHDAAIRREQQLAARDTIIQMHADTAAARTRERRVDSATVTRWLVKVRTDTAWRRDTVRIAGDSTPRIAVPIPTLTRYDSIAAGCARLTISSSREHVADSAVTGATAQSLALARTGTASPPPAVPVRRWSLGVTLGWGAVAVHDSGRVVLRSGPALTAGVSYRVF